MILGLEARIYIYWNLLGQSGCKHINFWPTKLTNYQISLVLASIQQKPGISLKQGQLKFYVCQVYGLLKYVYYYEYRTPISFWLFHYTKSDIMPPPCLFIHCSGVVRKNPDMLFASNSKTFVVMYFINRPNPPMLLISS